MNSESVKGKTLLFYSIIYTNDFLDRLASVTFYPQ